MAKRKHEDNDVWNKLVAANDAIGSLGHNKDWSYASKAQKDIIGEGLKAIRPYLKSVVGTRKHTNGKEYCPIPKGETLHYRDMTPDQIRDLRALVALENLWGYKRDGKNFGSNLLDYHLTGCDLPAKRDNLAALLSGDLTRVVNRHMPAIQAANTEISTLSDKSGLFLEGPGLSTVCDGFGAIRELLKEAFDYKEDNFGGKNKLVVSKGDLSDAQIGILKVLVDLKYIWCYQGWKHHYLDHALRDIGLPLDFPRKLNADKGCIQKSLSRFLGK